MTDDELRRRIADADPADGAPVLSTTDPGAQALLEEIMNTPDTTTDTTTGTATDTATGATRDTTGDGAPKPARPAGSRRWWGPLAGVAAAAALVVGGLTVSGAFGSADDDPDVAIGEPGAETVDDPDNGPDPDGDGDTAPPALELSAGDADPALQSCMRPDATVAGMSETAFLGTVTAIDGETVTLGVDRWYVGGDAPVVTVTAPAGLEALTGSIDFVVGDPYIISAYEGVVAYCELSGPATPERRSWYDEAFGA